MSLRKRTFNWEHKEGDLESIPALAIRPTLNPDVSGVVAEFLAGEHAFGTLASLNLVNHAIHEETLPVLYETLLADRPDVVDFRRFERATTPLPARYHYVKYLILPMNPYGAPITPVRFLRPSFPRLTMVIQRVSHRACCISVFRPLKSSTAFNIIAKTPVALQTPPGPPGVIIRWPAASGPWSGTDRFDKIEFYGAGRVSPVTG